MVDRNSSKTETPSSPCEWFPACSGCDHLGMDAAGQRARHIAAVTSLLQGLELPEISFHRPGESAERNRLDFSLQDGRLGLYRRGADELVDLPTCLQLSSDLQNWLTAFRRSLPPLSPASVRLRTGPAGERGVWLDAANVAIKELLDEGSWLKSLPADVVVELGQRRKFVDRDRPRPKLTEPRLRPWFRSRCGDMTVPLYGAVGSFTQPSLRANDWITAWFADRVRAAAPAAIVEFGSGNGNLSFPALSGGARLIACETDELALSGFRRSLDELAAAGHDLRPRVTLEHGDFHRRGWSAFAGDADALIANPARSGLRGFLDPLPQAEKLRHVFYMSCHPESFAVDARRLHANGFRAREITLLDQFPQTKHIEVLSVWSRD